MRVKLFIIRKLKGLFLFLNLHYLFGWLNGFFLNLAFLSEFSLWRKEIDKPLYDDFYTFRFKSMKRYGIFEYLVANEIHNHSVNYLEFGVAFGKSFRWWIMNNTNPDSRFFGFDTFGGLPEDWHLYKKGDMSPGGKFPDINNDSRAEFIPGLFQDTLLEFLGRFNDDKRKVIHLDADLYSSTIYVLTSLASILRKGDILIFDEFGVPTHEFRAFHEFTTSFYIKYEVLAAANNYLHVAFKIL